MVNQADVLSVVWGCDPTRQLERGWINALVAPASEEQLLTASARSSALGMPVILVESGLLRLQRAPDPAQLAHQKSQRHQRIQSLASTGRFGLIHLSDEEGLDGDDLYPMLPEGTPIWRNFSYPRHRHAHVFPIGPRVEFLLPELDQRSRRLASARPYPWTFMGTLWASGQRLKAASLFLRSLPHGYFYGGRGFSQGLPLPVYQEHLFESCFALCPDGDRHFDTFRLYESLQCGCIPVVVDQRDMASLTLGGANPFPIFKTWEEALIWVQQLLQCPEQLDALQALVQHWWRQNRTNLRLAMRQTLGRTSS
ncbi:exostosin domain-containing protein [Synechococcus sp. LTW-G]